MSVALDYLIAHQGDIHSLSAQVQTRQRQTQHAYRLWVQESINKAEAVQQTQTTPIEDFRARLRHPPNGGGHDHQFHERR